jgi:hypothetical protein
MLALHGRWRCHHSADSHSAYPNSNIPFVLKTMARRKLFARSSLILLTLLIAGCALNDEVRFPPPSVIAPQDKNRELIVESGKPPYSSLETYKLNPPANDPNRVPFSHTTAYIEFDEQGDFLDRRQLEAALSDNLPIYNTPKRLLIFYAHGWQNNTRSRDVALFNQFIAHLNEALAKVDDDVTRQRWTVYGVYLAWRGTTFQPVDYVQPHDSSQIVPNIDSISTKTDVPLWGPVTAVKYFTFWSRQTAAARFAGGPLLETIQAISNKVRSDKQGPVFSRTILMGHSFGAYIVEKTLLQSFAAEEISSSSDVPCIPENPVGLG